MQRSRCLAALALTLGACGLKEYPEDCPDVPLAAPAPLQRLSVRDYERTLRSLLGDAAVDDVASVLAALPADLAQEEGAFARQDQRLTQRHVDQTFAVADALAQRAATDGSVRTVAGDACGDTVDDACLSTFVPTFLARALRRPPSPDELERAWELVDDHEGTDRIHAVVFTTLLRPEVLYRFENRGDASEGVVTLTAFEVASRLSYHFWGEPPDEPLLAAAASGGLDTDAGMAEQVRRLFDDPRTQRTIDAFFTEWLHLERGEYGPSPRLGVLAPGLALDGLAAEMRQEALDLVHHTVQQDRTWHHALTTTDSFARTARLAGLYGVDPWDGTSAPPSLPAHERAGLLTRAALLATQDGSTNPFRRGAFVRRLALCQEVPAPPADLPPDALVPPPATPGATTREAFAAKVTGNDCAGCHLLFSDLGYALESYDGLGRYRTEEHLVSDDGQDLGLAPVDASVETFIDAGIEPFADAVALSHAIADSPESSWCLSRQYFRYSARRAEGPQDACRLDAWTARLEADEPLGMWLQQVALDPAFRQRRLED